MYMTTQKKEWYVVYTYPNSEKKIYNELEKRRVTAFLPTRKVTRQWSDRKKKLEIPLFPNYVFVKVPPREMWMVLMVNGIVRFISFEGTPATVKDAEIEMVQKLLTECYEINDEDITLVGEKVKVKGGPLAGLTGSVIECKGRARLHVALETIGRAVSVNIDADLLERLN